MSAVTISQIARKVKELYATHVPSEDLNEKDPEYDIKVTTRCLAAFAVQNVCECTEAEAGGSVIDGGDDNGIDAVYYSEHQNKLVVVQAKWIKSGISEPESGEVNKFCTGVKDLVNSCFDRFNSKLKKRQFSIESALSTFNCRIQLILIHTGRDTLGVHSNRYLSDLVSHLNDASDIASYDNLPQKEIYKLLLQGAGGGSVNLELSLSNWGKTEEPHKAFYGMISGCEIREWFRQHGDQLFARNLRSVLGATDVNKQINDTILNRPEDFWYFNNGITVIATGVEKAAAGSGNREAGIFRATNAHIVNGAQTVSTIGKFSGEEEQLAKVFVPARIISLEDADESYGALITRTNNTQNRIESRDFVSQDPEQHRLRSELQMDGVEYHISRSESFTPSPTSFNLEEATIAAASSQGEPGMAVQVKREIGRLWVDLDRAPYKKLFNAETNSKALYHAVLVSRVIDAKIGSLIKGLDRRSGKKYLVLIHGNRLLSSIVFHKLNMRSSLSAEGFDLEAYKSKIESEVEVAANCLTKNVEKKFADSFPATIFKNPTKSESLFNLCTKKESKKAKSEIKKQEIS
ncbi:hypothetical protein EON81_00230 [bacterium]|nr:MAG: hypothetical protein EON81_00230 [bacterium]